MAKKLSLQHFDGTTVLIANDNVNIDSVEMGGKTYPIAGGGGGGVTPQAILDNTEDTASVTRTIADSGKVAFSSPSKVSSVNTKTGDVILTAGDINTNVLSGTVGSIPDDTITGSHPVAIPLGVTGDNYDSSNLTGLVTWTADSFPGWASMAMAIVDRADETNRITVAYAPEPGAGNFPQAVVNWVGDLSQFKDKEIQLVIDNAYANFTIDFTGKNHLTIVHYISEPSTQTIQQAIDYLDNATYTETTIREQEDDVIREQLSGVDRRTEMITSTGDGTKYLADDGTYKTVSGGTSTDVQINGTSITSNNTANILTQSAYDASTNKIATVSDIKNITVGANSGLAISNTNVLSFDNKLWNNFIQGTYLNIEQADFKPIALWQNNPTIEPIDATWNSWNASAGQPDEVGSRQSQLITRGGSIWYANRAETNAIATSEAYTDSAIAGLDIGANKDLTNLTTTGESHFDGKITSAKADAITTAEAYTDNAIANLPPVPTVNIPWSSYAQLFDGGSATYKIGEIQSGYTQVEFIFGLIGGQNASNGSPRNWHVSFLTDLGMSCQGYIPEDFSTGDNFYYYNNADTGFIEIWVVMTGGFRRLRQLAYRTLYGQYVSGWATGDLPEGAIAFKRLPPETTINTIGGAVNLIAKNQSQPNDLDNNPIGVDEDPGTKTIALGFTASKIIDNQTLEVDTDTRQVKVSDSIVDRVDVINTDGDGSQFLGNDGQYHAILVPQPLFFAPDYANAIQVLNGPGTWRANENCFIQIHLSIQGNASDPVITYATINDTLVLECVLGQNAQNTADYQYIIVPVLIGDQVSITLASGFGGTTTGEVFRMLKRAAF